MKKIIYNITFILFLIPIIGLGQTTIWSETFESYSDNAITASNNNTTNSANDWTTTITSASYFRVENDNRISGNRSFAAQNARAVWLSEDINITGYTNVNAQISIKEVGNLEADDFIRVEYQLDGGSFTTFTTNGYKNNDFSSATSSVSNLSGTTLRIRVTIDNDNDAEFHIFDDISVTGIFSCDPCYSVANGNINSSSTWSNVSGGTAGATPKTDGTGSFVIEGGRTVNMNTDFRAKNITVGSSGNGILIWTGDNLELTIENSGTVTINSGSKIDEGNRTNAALYFISTNALVVNDATNGLEIDDIFVNANATLNINGSGKILVNNDMTFNGDDATITTNITGSFTITDDLLFPDGNDRGAFTNNGLLTVNSEIFLAANSNNDVFVNNGTLTIGGNFTFEDVGFEVTNSTLTNNGTMSIGGDLFLGNDNCIVTNNGTLTITDELYFAGNSDNCALITGNGSTTTINNQIYYQLEPGGEGTTNNTITNAGTFTVTNSVVSIQYGITITNQATGTMTVTDFWEDRTGMDVINAGILNVTDFELNDSNDEMDIINSGTLNFVNVAPSNGDMDITNTGTINQTGNFIANEIDADADFINSTNGIWNYSGTNHDSATRLFCSATGNTFNYNRAGNQQMIDVQSNIYYHLEITVSGTKSSADNMDINGNLTISGSATLDVNSGSDDITIAGNWINTSSGGFTEGSRSVTFDGTGNQTITCSTIGAETFYGLLINKSNGSQVILNNEVILDANNSYLNFSGTNGYINLNGNNFTINQWSNGKITGYSSTEFFIVDQTAFIKYTGITNGEVLNIPMGLAAGSTNYALADLTMTNAGSGTLDANLCGQIQLDGGVCSGTAVTTKAVNYTWNFVSTSNNANVKLYWDTSKELSSFNRAASRVIHHNGTIWEQLSVVGAATLSSGSLYYRSGNTTGFSPFGVEDGSSILPIKLLSFGGVLIDNQVKLDWITSTEINNDFFTIERSNDGKTFEAINIIKGQGNSFSEIKYNTIDENPSQGISYYRLKQTDFDGKYSYSSIIKIENSNELEASIFPNPLAQGNPLAIHVNIPPTKSRMIIYNTLGQEVYSDEIALNGTTLIQHQLITGTYIIKIVIGNNIIQQKLVVE